MKQILFFTAIIITISSCHHISGSGNIISSKRVTGDFTGISASNAIDVEVRVGAPQEVLVEADDNIVKYIVTTVSGDILKITMEDNTSISNSHMKVYVTAPSIKSLKASSSADIVVKGGLKSDGKLTFHASSSGSISATLDAPEVEAEASSSAEIEITGKTKKYTADVSSSANIKSANLLSENTWVSAGSSGNASVFASVSLKAKASSSGDIEYRGNAIVEKTVNSSGSVEKKE